MATRIGKLSVRSTNARPAVAAAARAGLLALILAATSAALATTVLAQSAAPGGFLETADSTSVRQPVSVALPSRGKFTFPAPYNTTGIRITNSSDCGGGDCVYDVGYSYWRRMNNHVGSDTMYIYMGLNQSKGGAGPTLYSYNKVTDQVTNLGPLFDASNSLSAFSGEGWYFSATLPTKLYVYGYGTTFYRYDVVTRQLETVFDAAGQFGSTRYIWQLHSSNDDRVHSGTLRDKSTDAMLGCFIYREDTRQFSYYPKSGDFDECQVDKSGQWLVIKQGTGGADDTIVNLATGAQVIFYDKGGAPGHSDNGFGYMVGADNWNNLPGAQRVWYFDQPFPTSEPGGPPPQGLLVYHTTDWNADINHLSHANAKAGTPVSQQYMCGGGASRQWVPRNNEIVCFPLDGSLRVLVVAPVMTDLNASGGGSDDYTKMPKGNLDVTGQYFIWTSNVGGNRLDAFIVKVPSQLLTGVAPPSSGSGSGTGGSTADTTAPTLSITAPGAGATLSGTTTVSASAADHVGVAGVQFKVNGQNLGAEVTTAPYSIAWNTASGPDGSYTLTAVARDAAGNTTASAGVTVSVSNAVASGGGSTGGSTGSGGDTTGGGGTGSGGTSSGAGQNVTWTSLVNVTATGNSLEKTSGCDGCPDAGAVSTQQFGKAGGYVEFTATDNPAGALRYVGLNKGGAGNTSTSIKFAIRMQDGLAEVRESNHYRTDIFYAPGDVFRITVASGVVTYYKNGELFYTSRVKPSYPLLVDTSLESLGATVDDVVVSTNAP